MDEVELKHLADIISGNPSKQNREMQDEIKKMFGIDMKIPAAMNASKKAKDFIWISNNASSGMQNLLVMKVKSEERRMKNSNALHVNDKALKALICTQSNKVASHQPTTLHSAEWMQQRKGKSTAQKHGNALRGGA